MANATIRFPVDTGTLRSKLYATKAQMRMNLLRIDLIRAKKRLHRAYLNMLRSTRRTRKAMVRRWELAKLRVRVCEMRIAHPHSNIRVVLSRSKAKGPRMLIETIFACGQSEPSKVDLRTILLGHRASIAEIDECPVEILASSDR